MYICNSVFKFIGRVHGKEKIALHVLYHVKHSTREYKIFIFSQMCFIFIFKTIKVSHISVSVLTCFLSD